MKDAEIVMLLKPQLKLMVDFIRKIAAVAGDDLLVALSGCIMVCEDIIRISTDHVLLSENAERFVRDDNPISPIMESTAVAAQIRGVCERYRKALTATMSSDVHEHLNAEGTEQFKVALEKLAKFFDETETQHGSGPILVPGTVCTVQQPESSEERGLPPVPEVSEAAQ